MAATFNGTGSGGNNLINCQSLAALDNIEDQGGGGVTHSLWYFSTGQGNSSFANIFTKNDASAGAPSAGVMWFYHNGNATLVFEKDYDGVNNLLRSTSTTVTTNLWHHILVTWDGGATATNIHIYFDNVECSYTTTQNGVGNKVSDAALTFRIANLGGSGTPTNAVQGSLTEYAIYNKILDATERGLLYGNGSPLKGAPLNIALSNLKAYWKLDEAPNGVTLPSASGAIIDYSGNANHGTTLNSPVGKTEPLFYKKPIANLLRPRAFSPGLAR